MMKEFKEFALRGSVVDLAVGLIIGVAFGAIVNSFVNDVLMPVIGLVVGGTDFSNLFVLLRDGNPPGPYASVAAAKAAGAATLNYGIFINLVVNFLIVAFALFMVIKAMNRLRRQEPPPPAAPSEEIVLLQQIRDSLKR